MPDEITCALQQFLVQKHGISGPQEYYKLRSSIAYFFNWSIIDL